MESEQDRLERLYTEMSEEHLQDMQQDLRDDPESLTDDARLALGRVLRARGLAAEPARDQPAVSPMHEQEQGFSAGIPGVFPSSAGLVEQALEPGGQRRDGMVNLITFFDGLQLSTACAALEDAEIDLAVERIDGDAQAGAPPSFAVWVEEPDRLEAQSLLREAMGLFPRSEIEDGSDAAYAGELMPLGQFETAEEQERVRALLGRAGIACTLGEEADGEGKRWYTVEVEGAEFDRGLQVVADGLALG